MSSGRRQCGAFRRKPEQCRHLKFLGRIPRAQIAGEFAAADLLVLPSLAEGSAETTYEALACGVPVVTTLEAGSVVRDGIDGRIVPSRDPVALADAIAEIVEDRQNASGCHAPRATGHTIIRGTGTANACWLRSGKIGSQIIEAGERSGDSGSTMMPLIFHFGLYTVRLAFHCMVTHETNVLSRRRPSWWC